MDLHENSGLATLEAAGLMEAFWANHRPDLDSFCLTDANGTVLHKHLRQMSGAGKRPEIERGPLRDLLLDSLQPGTVQWDCQLESSEIQGEQILLRFANGHTSVVDIAVGSDGANSRMRELVILLGRSMSEFRSQRASFLRQSTHWIGLTDPGTWIQS